MKKIAVLTAIGLILGAASVIGAWAEDSGGGCGMGGEAAIESAQIESQSEMTEMDETMDANSTAQTQVDEIVDSGE